VPTKSTKTAVQFIASEDGGGRYSGHPLRLPFSATAMVGCSMNIRLPHRDGTMVNGALTPRMGKNPQRIAVSCISKDPPANSQLRISTVDCRLVAN
jgi:hypothetical protein